MRATVLLFAFSIFGCALCRSDDYDGDYEDDGVSTASGKIMAKVTEFYGQLARAYLGIPYAKPPVGDLRFKKPEPIEPWAETLVADTMPPACVQHSQKNFPWYDSQDGQSEDCLYLNIWTGRYPPKMFKTPVMFWIYGGEFTVGSNRIDAANGQGLSVLGRAVVVSPNYRVGSMGFLSSGTEDAPGNVGIYDIIMALQWVQDNIKAFGGDPDQITIFGQGSGSMTVSLFLMSPLTKGLFSKAIMQSGSFLANQVDPNDHNLRLGQRLAEAVDCASSNHTLKDDPKGVTECLKGVEADRLATTLSTFDPILTKSFLPQYGDDFLPKNPVEDLKSGNFHEVPLMIGSNKDEGSYILTSQYQDLFGASGERGLRITKSYGATILRRMFSGFPDPEAVVEQYLGDFDEDDYDEVRNQVYTAAGDYNITCPTVYFAEKYRKSNNTVEYYLFAQRPNATRWAPWMGVTHYDEVAFAFGRPLVGYNYDQFMNHHTAEVALSAKMIEIWSDFALLGNGIEGWKSFSSTHHQYMLLQYNVKKKMRGPGPHLDNCNFFRKYYDM